jgi:4-aminobutyrate aminotransferase-like enzyme
MLQDLARHQAEFRRYMRNQQFERTADGGLYFPKAGAIAHGVYEHDVNGQDVRQDKNLLTTEGMNYLLLTGVANTALIAAWYFALYSAAASPTNAWTASNFPVTNATEITSTTEGYTETLRQAFTPTVSGASVNNTAAKAAFTIATATALIVNGCGLLSVSTRGSTSGKLLSAARFASQRSLSSGDVFNLGYTLTLTSS